MDGLLLAAGDSLLQDNNDKSGDSGDDLLTDDSGSGSDDSLLDDSGSGGSDDNLLGGDNSGGSDDSLLNDSGSDSGSDSGGSLLGGDDGGSDSGGGLLNGNDKDESSLPSGSLLGGSKSGGESGEQANGKEKASYDMHKAAFEAAGNRYPSANECATCHPRQYRQWSVSQHAYAQLSPVYMAMQMTVNAKTSGTNGDFCIRCHNPVGMNLNESVYTSNLDRPPTSREGVTCVVCHRIAQPYGKVSGRLPLVEGDLSSPVYGPTGDKELKRVLSQPGKYRVVTDRNEAGRVVHRDVKRFFQLTRPGFCGTCHDVKLLNGFRLEEAFSEFQRTAAADEHITCQDCHMGKVQGRPSGYDHGPAAVVGGVPTQTRKLSNHYFAGPDYPIVSLGIFPHNVKAAKFKSLREWLQFDYKSGWGTDKFEKSISLDHKFPDAWFSIDDRYDARKIIAEQQKRLEWAHKERLELLRNGFKLGNIRVTRASADGLSFRVDVRNGINGDAVPTGFDAERLIFLKVQVRDRNGKLVYVSGNRDPNGDVRDSHSLYVHNGDRPLDEDLFSLQSKFPVRLARGGEREEVLPVNNSLSPLPFVRPETRATTLYGRPRGARKHKRTIPPLDKRTATYDIPASQLGHNGPYTINVKLIAQAVPVNLIAAIQSVGFDYGMSPKEIANRVVQGADTLYEKKITVRIPGADGKQAADDAPRLPDARRVAYDTTR